MILNKAMREQMQAITRTLMTGGAGAATGAIQNVLKGVPAVLPMPGPATSDFLRNMKPGIPNDMMGKHFQAADAMPAFVEDLLSQLNIPAAKQGWSERRSAHMAQPEASATQSGETDAECQGRFLTKSFTNHAGTRNYKLYIPGSYHGQAMPVVVMLHGCTQNPDDFASGTRMNAMAEERQCFVVYPAQSQTANSSKCWNWFNSIDQQREQGEPSIIAGITREVVSNYKLDADRVYVTGLSSGGAMAVIMATAYPELYAAVGVHSGLPYASAHDLPSAFAAMRGSGPDVHAPKANAAASPPEVIPIIIFHGDSDTTVNVRNGERLMKQNVQESAFAGNEAARHAKPVVIVEQGQVPGGHRYTCTSHQDGEGRILAEHWVIHGAGHAWAGGSKSGTYTDAKGPDATREMLRFFYTQSRNSR